MKLSIDTTDNRVTKLKLDDKQLIKNYDSPRDQDVLKAIDELLRREGKKLENITAIEVNLGPGAFTSLRVGISVANALRYALSLGRLVEPEYGQPPRITVKELK